MLTSPPYEHLRGKGCGWGAGPPGGLAPPRVLSHEGVASRYIDPPMLLDGRKFDIRTSAGLEPHRPPTAPLPL